MARPTKLTKELTEKICRSIRACNYPAVAAVAAGIAESTYYRWMDEGRSAKRGIHRDFYEAVQQAQAEAEARAVAVIAKAMTEEWRAALAFLERARSERWLRRERLENPVEERPVVDLSKLSDKDLKALERVSASLTEPQ